MNLLLPYSLIYVFIFLLGIIPPLPQISGYTHWIVTQHGMIEPIVTSYYHLRQSWNLVQLMQQEQHADFVQRIELQLNQVSMDLQSNQNYQTEVQKHYVDPDSRCVKASRLLSQLDSTSTHVLTLEAKGIASNTYLQRPRPLSSTESLQQPICQSFFHRNFSMCCFEHLQSIRNRSSIVGVPELSLYKLAMPPNFSPDEYGHAVAQALSVSAGDPSRNWILFNMAAFFWRVKGAARNAIECVRAALHTSPWRHQDVAMVSLANMLQLAQIGALDAALLVQNALIVSPQFAAHHHLMLGNIYAGLARFNDSLWHYRRAAALHQPMPLGDIEQRIFAAQCSLELAAAIARQQRQLDRQLAQIDAFHSDTDRFQWAKATMERHAVDNHTQIRRQALYEARQLLQQAAEENEKHEGDFRRCFIGLETCDSDTWHLLAHIYHNDTHTVVDSQSQHRQHRQQSVTMCQHLSCISTHQLPDQSQQQSQQQQIPTMCHLSCNMKVQHHSQSVDHSHTQSQSEHKTSQSVDHSRPKSQSKHTQSQSDIHSHKQSQSKHTQSQSEHTQSQSKHKQSLQPPQSRHPSHHQHQSMCRHLSCTSIASDEQQHNRSNAYLSIYMSPSTKGVDCGGLLTDKQGLTNQEEHPLPWHPPTCHTYINDSDLMPVTVVDSMQWLSQRHQQGQLDGHVDSDLLGHLWKLLMPHQGAQSGDSRHGALDDIGQRIVTAMERRLAPPWVTFSMAGLYWTVIGNGHEAMSCHKLAAKLSPTAMLDVALVNLAVVVARNQRFSDSLKLIKAALIIDQSQPATHIVAASLYNAIGKLNAAHHHLTIATQQDPLVGGNYLQLADVKCRLCHRYHRTNATRHSMRRNRALRHNVTQIFVNYKMCSSTAECGNIIGKNYQFLPHIKVTIKGPTFSPSDIEKLITINIDSVHSEVANSHIMYGILWNTNLSNLHIQEHDCLLTNDSSRSVGCHHNEEIFTASQNAINFLADLRALLEAVAAPVVSKLSSQWSDNKHVCHNDRTKTIGSPDDQVHQATLKSNTNDIQEAIVNMVSSRVVLNPLAPEDCEKVAPFDFKTYTPLYVSLNTMRINVVSLLDSLAPGYLFTFNPHPYCVAKGHNFLRQMVDKYQIDFDSSPHSKVPEFNLHASFLKTFDDKYSLEDIGKRLYTGLQQNSTDWRLAMIVVNYWRVSGDAQQAFNCLEMAMENSPEFHEKVILVNAANILYRLNKLEAALDIAHQAMQYPESQNWIVIPFLVANIFARMDQWHKATLFYEICLSLKADFEEAIYRIKSIQCQQMVLQNLEQH